MDSMEAGNEKKILKANLFENNKKRGCVNLRKKIMYFYQKKIIRPKS